MKQTERRTKTDITIECEMSLREKIRTLFSKKFVIRVNLSCDSGNGILESEYNIATLKGSYSPYCPRCANRMTFEKYDSEDGKKIYKCGRCYTMAK